MAFSGREQWQTIVFTTLAFAQVFQALGSRSSKESLFKIGIFSNPTLAGMALLVVALQLAVLYIPALSALDLRLPRGRGLWCWWRWSWRKFSKTSRPRWSSSPIMALLDCHTCPGGRCQGIQQERLGFGNPSQQRLFDVLSLSALDLGIAAGAGAVVFVAMEVEKKVTSRQ